MIEFKNIIIIILIFFFVGLETPNIIITTELTSSDFSLEFVDFDFN